MPFLLLGIVVSSLVHVFVSEDRLLRLIPRNPVLSLVPALGMGMLMPVCECGNVAVARRFLAKGVPVSSCITFLLAAPILNPVALLATATAFRYEPSMVWLRGGLAFLVARLAADNHDHGHHHAHGPASIQEKVGRVGTQASAEFVTMMQVLLIGAAIAAATQVLIPRTAITGLGSGVVLGVVAMMSLAFVLSICSTVDAFFALSYSNIFPTPALLAFLVFGPMLSMKGVAMLLTAFRPRVVLSLVAVTVEIILLSALVLNLRSVLL